MFDLRLLAKVILRKLVSVISVKDLKKSILSFLFEEDNVFLGVHLIFFNSSDVLLRKRYSSQVHRVSFSISISCGSPQNGIYTKEICYIKKHNVTH